MTRLRDLPVFPVTSDPIRAGVRPDVSSVRLRERVRVEIVEALDYDLVGEVRR